MCAKFGCGPTVVSKKRGGGQTDRQTDRQTDKENCSFNYIVYVTIINNCINSDEGYSKEVSVSIYS